MSFTTRCPACGTVFRVVADQLKISDGWVRCGHCSDVFDATIHLEAWAPPPARRHATVVRGADVPEARTADAAFVESADAQGPAEVPFAPQAAALQPQSALGPTFEADDANTAASEALTEPMGLPELDLPDQDLQAWFGDGPLDAPVSDRDAASAQLSDTPMAAHRPEAGDSDFETELQRFASSTRGAVEPRSNALEPSAAGIVVPGLHTQDRVPAPVSEEAEPLDDAPEPGFVRQARNRAFWRSPGVLWGMGLSSLLLAVLLAGQWAVHERHRLVVAQPALKPWIEQACARLGCDLKPLQRIDAVVIESSELVRRLGDFYSFDLVVRNQSAIDVAVPALELSLTDLRGQVVARRVFLPQDWPNAPAHLPASGSLNVSFRLALSLPTERPMAGYRALVFYP